MKVCDVWVKDEVWAVVTGLSPEDFVSLWNLFGIDVEGSFFMPARKLGRWDGKIRFFDKQGRIFLRLLPEMANHLDHWGYTVNFHDERRPVKPINIQVNEGWFAHIETPKIKLRPYQVSAVNAAITNGSGFIVAATGAGKTIMINALCDAFNKSGMTTLVIVPSIDLAEQTAATFKLTQTQVSTYTGASKEISQNTIATWQSLQNRMDVISEFDVVIVDEAHGATAKTIGDLITNHGKNIAYRYGFTGTMPKPLTDQYTLRGSIGEVLFSISARELIDLGYLAKLEIEPIQIQENVDEDFPDYGSEKSFVSRSTDRLDLIADLIIAKAAQYGNTLVLVHSVKQGRQLQELIKDSVFLYGETESDVRAEWYSTFESRDDLIVIATSGIASTGISIDRVFNLMLIDAGKSFVKAIQSIGRGLRKGHDKEEVHVCDVHSSLKWGKKHARERKRYYQEAGYPVLKTVKVKP
jgi:superfamily II DNA or RNA helicase